MSFFILNQWRTVILLFDWSASVLIALSKALILNNLSILFIGRSNLSWCDGSWRLGYSSSWYFVGIGMVLNSIMFLEFAPGSGSGRSLPLAFTAYRLNKWKQWKENTEYLRTILKIENNQVPVIIHYNDLCTKLSFIFNIQNLNHCELLQPHYHCKETTISVKFTTKMWINFSQKR